VTDRSSASFIAAARAPVDAPDAANAMGERGRRYAQSFASVRGVTDAFERLFTSLVNARREGRRMSADAQRPGGSLP
jgi:hypothetical protein